MGYQNPPFTTPVSVRVNDKPLAIKCRLEHEQPSYHHSIISLYPAKDSLNNVLFSLISILFNSTTSCQSLAGIIHSVKTCSQSLTKFRHNLAKVFQSLKTSCQTLAGLFYTMAELFCFMANLSHEMANISHEMANISQGLEKYFRDLLHSVKYMENHCRKLLAIIYISPRTEETLINITINLITT